MNYNKIMYYDVGNARGLSTVLFVQGCEHGCDGCFNKETWDFNGGKIFTEDVQNEIIESLNKPQIKNFVISGGDPCNLKNIETIISLCKKIKKKIPAIKIIVYTGFKLQDLWNRYPYLDLFKTIDYLIDGKFIKELPTKSLDYRGSTNQKCYTFYNIMLDDNGKILSIPYYEDITEYYFKEYKNKN